MGKHNIKMPVLDVKLIPLDKIKANDYNPNKVATPEMKLLAHSIREDGYTMPIVVVYDTENDMYVIVDGFHRYRCAKEIFKLQAIPCTILDKPIKDRMASTIRHNRARGEHQVVNMSGIVAELFVLGWEDEEIGKHLGMGADEVLRLKQNTGISEIFKNHAYSKSWE